MKSSPSSEAYSRSASQYFLRAHYRVHNSPPLNLILYQMNTIHILALILCYFNYIFNIILPFGLS
jgi:hypothetical protein